MKMTYAEGEAPWSMDEEFAEAGLACKARRKQFGECFGEGDYDGQCDDCMYEARDVLAKLYSAAPTQVGAA